jgi:hypothetical protein
MYIYPLYLDNTRFFEFALSFAARSVSPEFGLVVSLPGVPALRLFLTVLV